MHGLVMPEPAAALACVHVHAEDMVVCWFACMHGPRCLMEVPMYGLLPFRPCTTAVPLLRFFLTPRCSSSLPESLLLVALLSSLLVTLFPGRWGLPLPLTPLLLMSILQCWSGRGALSSWLRSSCSVVVAALASGAGAAAVNKKLVSIKQATQQLRRVQAALMTAHTPHNCWGQFTDSDRTGAPRGQKGPRPLNSKQHLANHVPKLPTRLIHHMRSMC